MDNKQTIEGVYNKLKELKLVYNQADFSRMCGKSSMWFSCIKARRLPITTHAALTLAYKLRRKARTSICPNTYAELMQISDDLLQIAEMQVAKRVDMSEQWVDLNEG